jgi:hypothetical protein
MEIEALEVSARCHFAIHRLTPSDLEMSTAETLLENAIRKSVRTYGAFSGTTIALQHTLWLWLLEQGRNSEANILRKTMDGGTQAPQLL